MKILLLILLFFPVKSYAQIAKDGISALSLAGKWQMGSSRNYTDTVMVPGIAADPTKMSNDVLWYKKEVKLPGGKWNMATLELKGARFAPQVYINGELAGKQNGGMAPTFFHLKNSFIKPYNKVTIEIALASLKNIPPTDASYIPGSDQWRSNVSSGLWDDVVLHLHREVSIDRVIPFTDLKDKKVSVRFDLAAPIDFSGKASIQLKDKDGNVLIDRTSPVSGNSGEVSFAINSKLKNWSPDSPMLYSLELTVSNHKGQVCDRSAIPFGLKNFKVKNKRFYLNDKPFLAKGVTVVWHRWIRTPEGRELGYDTAWFYKNIIKRSKDMGANYLRFHLGKPPELYLDMCDRYGLIVQYEWSFFHGMPASKESLLEQYKPWLDLAVRHPSVSMIHPYNETGGDQLKTVWEALDQLLPAYPPMVLEDRDVIHIHKYWWSMFENLGVYYDSAAVFPKAVIADEFGGNYLDNNGNLGKYPSLKESFLRFLGRSNTAAERLTFQAVSNARVAEYWRRIGAAGFSPFCSLGSNEDGNTWFMGDLHNGKPKPVWEALTASFSPRSVSVEIWDRNFEPAQTVDVPVYVFNDTDAQANLSVQVSVEDKAGQAYFKKEFTAVVGPFSKEIVPVAVRMPADTGNYTIKAVLMNRPSEIKYPVVSEWDIRVLKSVVPQNIRHINVAVAADEVELISFMKARQIQTVSPESKDAAVLLTSLKTWNRLAAGDKKVSAMIHDAILKGRWVVMLDVGERGLGQGYPKKSGDLGPLQGVQTLNDPKASQYQLFGGIILRFAEAAEPESYIHPDKNNSELWYGLNEEHTRIWNGLRGGLNVPAADMEISGLSANAFVSQWRSRGADEAKLLRGPYYGYELQGFYAFSEKADDSEVKKKLKAQVAFLVQDAPALASSINPLSPVMVTDLTKGYREAGMGMADNFAPLANAGKNLTKTPVALIGFGPGKGELIVSQLLTAGRLAKGYGESGLYGVRYDEVAVQFVLNMISLAVKKQ